MWWFTQTWFYPSALLRQNSRPYFFRSSWKDVSQNHRKPIFRTSPWRLVLKEGGSVRGLAGAPAEDRLLSVYRRIWNQDLWIRAIPVFLFFFVVGFVGLDILDILVSWHLVNDLQYYIDVSKALRNISPWQGCKMIDASWGGISPASCCIIIYVLEPTVEKGRFRFWHFKFQTYSSKSSC